MNRLLRKRPSQPKLCSGREKNNKVIKNQKTNELEKNDFFLPYSQILNRKKRHHFSKIVMKLIIKEQAQEGNSRVRQEMTNKRLRDMY